MRKITLIFLLLATILNSFGQQLDTTFNLTGKTDIIYTTGAHFSQGIHQQSDGKIILTSNSGGYYLNNDFSKYYGYSYFATRYNINGSIDTSFGSNGTTKVNFPHSFNGHSEMSNSILQTDGKLVMIGYSTGPIVGEGGRNPNAIAIARLDLNGQLDSTFNSNGLLMITYETKNILGTSIAQQNDGKLVCTSRGGADGTSTLVRINLDGTLDNTFGTNGKVSVSGGSLDEMVIDTNQKIVVQQDVSAVNTYPGGPTAVPGKAIFKRFLSNGNIDSGFGTNGQVECTFLDGFYNEIVNILALPNGKYLVSGRSRTAPPTSSEKGFIAKFKNDGTLDTGFASTGYIFFEGHNYPLIKLMSNGNYFLIGQKSTPPPAGQFVPTLTNEMMQFNEIGTLNTAFGTNGVFVDNVSSVYYNCFDFQTDGKLIVGGSLNPKGVGIARFGNPSLSNSDFELTKNTNVFPNPSTGIVNIKLENTAKASIKVYDLQGKLVQEKKNIIQNTTLNLPKGLFLILIEQNNQKTTRKVIVN